MPRTAYSTATVPAFSKTRVPLIVSPSFSGSFRSMNMRWYPPGFNSTVAPGLISSPPSTGFMRMTSPSMRISCTSTLAASGNEPPTRRSGVGPALVMRRYPPPTLAPPGVARDQGCSRVSGPAFTGCAARDAADDANARRGRFQAVRILARGRHLGPFLGAAVAFLHHGEIDRRAGLVGIGEAGLEHELVVMAIVEGAGPDDVRSRPRSPPRR